MSTRTMLLLAIATAASCGGPEPGQVRISALAVMEAQMSQEVSLVGTFAPGTDFQWTASGGRFDGPTNDDRATFVAPETGPVTILCRITTPEGKTIVVDAQVTIGGSLASASPPPSADAAGDAAGSRDVESGGFVPSGFMGDAAALKVDPASMEQPHTAPRSQKWTYTPSRGAADAWAAVAWQFPRDNWGVRPGRNWNQDGFQEVSFWARGVADRTGAFPRVQFKAGGTTDPQLPYQASFGVEGEFVTLTGDWTRYTLDLRGRDLSQVIAAFVFVIRGQDVGPDGATFYLDDIQYR